MGGTRAKQSQLRNQIEWLNTYELRIIVLQDNNMSAMFLIFFFFYKIERHWLLMPIIISIFRFYYHQFFEV